MTNSTTAFSNPYTNELVTSLIQAWVYIRVGSEDRESFSVLGQYGMFDVDIDFRKTLFISTYIPSVYGSVAVQMLLWGCRSRRKGYVGTDIFWIALTDFDVEKFKTVSALPPCAFLPTDPVGRQLQ